MLMKKFGDMQKELDHEHVMRAHLESQVGNIPKKLKEYELELHQLIKDSGQRMRLVTSSLCAAANILGKKSNEEIMSLDTVGVKSPGGPIKRTR